MYYTLTVIPHSVIITDFFCHFQAKVVVIGRCASLNIVVKTFKFGLDQRMLHA